MKRFAAFLIALAGLFVGSQAHAQATRTWVSGVGDDANPCSRTAPCKTFAGAISKTATNGEINCLDPAGYGVVTIIKSITIDCAQTHGGILAANSNGVIVNGAGIIVTLRGLVINNAGTTAGNGIRILNAAAVNIDDTIIEYFGGTGTNGRGITIETAAANVRVNVLNTNLYNNNGIGIHSVPSAGSVRLQLRNVNIDRGGASGVQIGPNTTAVIDNSAITNHTVGDAVTIEQASSSLSISNSLLSNNVNGLFSGVAGQTPTTRLYGNVITANTSNGLLISSGTVISMGNNMIRGNAGNETPTQTITTN